MNRQLACGMAVQYIGRYVGNLQSSDGRVNPVALREPTAANPKESAMNARATPYVPLSSDNAALVLVDHQIGLLTGVRDIGVAELERNGVSLTKAMRILKVPTVVTTTARDSMWGPTFPELVSALADTKIIDRSTVNAGDDPKVAAAIEATGRKRLIFAGVS